jgi:hypothetical protein
MNRIHVGRTVLFIVFFSVALFLPAMEPSKNPMSEGFHYSVETGAVLRFDPSFGVHSLSVPFLSGALAGNGMFYLNLACELDFGAQFAYADFLEGLNFLVLPFGQYAGFRLSYMMSAGLAIFNHYGHIMEAALDLGIPLLFKDAHFCFEAGGFWRFATPILGYLGSGRFYGSTYGWLFSLSFRWRGLAPVSMPQLP